MEGYVSKHTQEESDALLKQVFDKELQDKEIEVTGNGTTEVTADEGYLALKSVKMNVNVQGGGGGNVEYLDLRSLNINGGGIVQFSVEARVYSEKNQIHTAGPAANAMQLIIMDSAAKVEAVGFDFSCNIVMIQNGVRQEAPASMIFTQFGFADQDIAAIPRMTKDEFYAL